jgi:hypothetical protein
MLTDDDAYEAHRDATRGLPHLPGDPGDGRLQPYVRRHDNGDWKHNRRRDLIERLPAWARAIEEYFWPWRGETE